MKRRPKAAKSAVSVELFPFLAVLMCTMGSLIVLLMIAVCHAREEATDDATAGQVANEPTAEDRALLERIAALRARREQALEANQEELRRRDASRTALESLRRELARATAALASPDQPATSAEQASRLTELRGRIADLELELDDARRAVAAPPSYAILPFDGPNGTHRRPIYIECRRDQIVLQPEGIVLTERDFIGPDGINPLIAALKAASDYYTVERNDAREPYPLLIVRPEGIGAYYVARGAIKHWTGESGYELVDADWKLDYQDPDPQLKQRLESMVEIVRLQQRNMAVATAGGGLGGGGALGSGGQPRYRVSNRGGLAKTSAGDPSRSAGNNSADFNEFAFGDASGVPDNEAGERTAQGSATAMGSASPRGGSSAADANDESLLGGGPPDGSGRPQGLAGGNRPGGTQFGARDGAAAEAGSSNATGPAGGERGRSASAHENNFLTRGAQGGNEGAGGPARTGQASPSGPGSPGSPGDIAQQDSAAGTPPAEFRVGEYQERVKRLADAKGKDWALKNATASSLPITRPLRVQCSASELTLFPDRPGDPASNVRFGERTTDCADAFRTALWERMDHWGIAGRGMHWKPILEVDVVSGGEQRFADLERMLDGSGLTVKQRRGPAPRTARPRR